MAKKGKTERPAVPNPKSPTEAGSIGELDETFIDDLIHILLKSYGGKIQRLMIVNGCWTSTQNI